ncbi:adenylosuccinate synthetase [Massilia pseudoviolaceinigra]|uniref:adenylosuccinate synthetase n=1 Tax=Massilia pseudoviolaceinigra TaxID=3057165 RepID=UPI002796A28C|nr:adenylosuccinate synthetase [Massilia sp. CCM 9206]MDQ1921539.1 adenylosuccinate synthetase [Massilia sp. CCM 9206]
MSSTRLVSLLGLGFGDCGKGLFTDYLCRHWGAHTVVRFNGGAQAGHNVVLPDGRHHTFAQFGAGSFVPGVATLLAYPVIVHPTALLVEDAYLRRAGVHDALARILIDGRCRVTTPFHQAAGRMRELQRGAAAHGSCGVGVGETAGHGIDHPEHIVRYADLMQPAVALAKLELMRRTLRAAFGLRCAEPANQDAYDAELAVLDDASMATRWLDRVAELTRQAPPAAHAQVAQRLHLPGCVLFEGAQGVLLDEWRGFHPHTTWSSIHPASVRAVATDAGQHARIEHLGILRSYMTRHGNGPLPTHDARLDHLPEPHNASDGWQGRFRRGHPDALLLRYALQVAGPLDGLLVSHLDVFGRERALRWCTGYETDAADDALCARDPDSGRISAILPGARHDLAHQERLGHLLAGATPHYTGEPVADAGSFVAQLEALTGLPVLLGSHGPTHETVRQLSLLP